MDKVSSNRRYLIIVSIISILPAVVLLYFITRYWVNVPHEDQWEFSIIFDKYYSKTLTFSDLIAQHNESRKLFPRLIILTTGLLTNWNVCVEMCITMFFACLISLNIFTLLNRTKDLSMPTKLILLSIINLMVFSPVQWSNWLWGIQMVVYIPAFALTTGLVINTSDISIRRKVIYNSILSIIGTFSYANGMLVWLLLLPVNILFESRHHKSKREKRNEFFYICLYAIAALLTIGFYFRGYRKPPNPSLLTTFYMPIEAIRFFLIWVGSPFIYYRGPYAAISKLPLFIGGLVFFTFVLSSTYCMYQGYKNSSKLSFFYPWFILGLYSIISGILTTLGRLGFGPYLALDSKYTTFSIYLLISVIVLVYLIYVFYIRDKKIIAKRFLAVQAFAILFFLILYGCVYRTSLVSMRWCNKCLQDGKLALQFYKVIPDNKNLNLLHPNPQFLVERFSSLTKIGLLDFKPVEPDILKYLENVNKDGNKSNGFFAKCLLLTDNKLRIHGRVHNPIKKNPANSVILVYTDENGNSKPFAILRLRPRRRVIPGVESLSDEAKVFKMEFILKYHFFDKIDIGHIPNGDLQISAWIVDVKEGIAYQLAGTHSIRKL